MIRITKETDYGIVLLSLMAAAPEGALVAARDLAARSALPLPMVSKILKALARADVLASQRGAKGGYRLSRDPQRITIGDIIEALEGPIGFTECSSTPGLCDQEHHCPARTGWQRINDDLKRFLTRIRLSDLVEPEPPRLLGLSGINAAR